MRRDFLKCLPGVIALLVVGTICVVAEMPFDKRPHQDPEEHALNSKKGWLKVKNTGGGWHNGGIMLGNHYLWVDANNNLRISNNKPNNANDGVIVGTQQ